MSSIIYGGLDVHQNSIYAALLNRDTGEYHRYRVANERAHLVKAVRTWSKLGELRLCYEASGAGFVIKRWMDHEGVACEVIAPSLIPKAPGDKVKTDRRDAENLACLYASGKLHAVRVPTPEEEVMRAVVRLRDQLTIDMTRVKNRILKLLALQGLRYKGRRWTEKHLAWIASLNLDPRLRLLVDCHLEDLKGIEARREKLDEQLVEIAQTDAYREPVQRLMCLKGISLHSALGLLVEIGDAHRFGKAPQLMSYFGLVPGEYSSGDKRRIGSITKMGNTRGRWRLTQAAWNQRHKPGKSIRLKKQWATQPPELVEIAKKAEERLHKTYWRIALRKDSRTAAVAVARELAGFVWAILTWQPKELVAAA